MLRGRPLETLCLVVLSPLRHTPMAGTRVDVEGAMEFLKSARREFPNVRIALGCAKTGGASQRKLEQCALESGFDSIAYPSEGLVEQARDMGFTVELRETCCAFAEPC